MNKLLWSLSLGVLALSWPALGAAQEGFAAATGTVTLEGTAWSWGFEAESPDELLRYGSTPLPRRGDIERLSTPLAIEGEQVGVLGGDLSAIAVRLDALTEPLRGRRAEIRLWYRPQGTSLVGTLAWIGGSIDGLLVGGAPSFSIHRMGQLSLQPTGRRTDDGWQELSSGPFDVVLGAHMLPAYLRLDDINVSQRGAIVRDPEARVWIDAIQIRDLGGALVPDAACSLGSEEQACGSHGLCYLGRCVDAAAYLGASPQDEGVRADYLARRRFEVAHFNGVRVAKARASDFLDHMQKADSPNAKLFWTELARAYNALIDGHSSTPRARTVPDVSGGACAYIGLADLLDDREAPLVYESFGEVPYGSLMEPGDVVTAIDGLSPEQALALLDREIDYGGDPRARQSMLTPRLMQWAAQTGSGWTISRCTSATACTPEQLSTIEISTEALSEALWRGEVPGWRFTNALCDFRFKRLDDRPGQRAYGFADTVVLEDAQLLLFNGFPAPQTGDGQSNWLAVMSQLLGSSPARVILDQRWGTGGSPAALTALHELLLRASDPALVGETIPALAQELNEGQRIGAQDCALSGRNCGLYALFNDTPAASGPAADTRLAILNGYDVSANDFFARRMKARPGRTRMFGHVPTFGAFGFACSVPAHLPGERNVGYQCTDTIFAATLGEQAQAYSSGTGVEPDVIVLQRQSDARLGVDTVRQAALQWLRQE